MIDGIVRTVCGSGRVSFLKEVNHNETGNPPATADGSDL